MTRRLWLSVIAISLGILGVRSEIAAQQRGTLIITMEGFERQDGPVRVALTDARSFLGQGRPIRAADGAVVDGGSTVVFDDVPFGNYAVQVYHDVNANGRLDRNFMGIPKEPYGFSNDATGFFGPPEYHDAEFAFRAPKMTIVVRVNEV